MSNRETPSSPKEAALPDPPGTDEPLPGEESDKSDVEEGPDDGYEVPKPWSNTYRDEDWEEDALRVRTQFEEPAPWRRFDLRHATPDEVTAAHAAMLAELTCEAFDAAMDYFEAARGIEDPVAAKGRKYGKAIRLSRLTVMLVGAADRHRRATGSG